MMKNNYALIARIISAVIMLIAIVMWIILAMDTANDGLIGVFVTYGNWMVIITTIMAVLSFVMAMIINPETIKGVVVGLGAVLVIFGLSYVLADSTVYPSYGDITEGTSKLVSTGLNSFYIVGLLAVLSVVYSGVARILK